MAMGGSDGDVIELEVVVQIAQPIDKMVIVKRFSERK